MSVPVGSSTVGPITNPANPAGHQIVRAYPPIAATITPVPVAAALKGGITGIAYSETISVQGGTSAYTFAVSTGPLPTSTSLNSSTGVISGTPSAAGTYSFTIKVTDAAGYVGTQAFTIVIAAPGGSAHGFVA